MLDCSPERIQSKMESTKSRADYLGGEIPIECGLKDSDFGGDGFPISVLSIQVWQVSSCRIFVLLKKVLCKIQCHFNFSATVGEIQQHNR